MRRASAIARHPEKPSRLESTERAYATHAKDVTEETMKVQDVMTQDPACCTPDTDLQQVARLMVQKDCGAIPIVDNYGSKRLLGIVTDRDIVCRTVALGKDPMDLKARDCMTTSIASVTPNDSVENCCQVMEEHDVRRVPVVDGDGCCCGVVSQADIARSADERMTAAVVRDISIAA
jgi:CBS domain-containing protein